MDCGLDDKVVGDRNIATPYKLSIYSDLAVQVRYSSTWTSTISRTNVL